MSFPVYDHYAPVDVAGLGRIPRHWSIVRMAYLESSGEDFVSGPFGSSLGSDDYVDAGVPVIRGVNTALHANSKFYDKDYVYVNDEKFESLKRCKAIPGDVIFTARGTVGKVGIVPEAVPKALISPNQLRFRPSTGAVVADFLFYVFASEPMFAHVILSSDSVAQPNMNLGSLKSLRIWLPPATEQNQIARFLDHETAKIDALIQQQQRLIELLKEKRQAVISHAVTKGLDPSVPMKDSGVEWLGEVPEHWEVVRFKHIARSIKAGPFGSALTKDMYTSSGYRVYGQEQVIPGDFKVGDYFISDEYYRELQQYSVEPQDILISCVGTFGKIAIVPADVEPGIINPRLIRVRVLDHTIPQFIEVTLKSYIVFEQFSLFSRGGTMDIINIATLSDIWLPIPPPSEQDSVVRWVESQSESFDQLITEAGLNIKLLVERRSALISAAVTGKIDVRNWKPPADESAFDEEVRQAGLEMAS
ncbi:MAG: restriction endonuclease subunit S [Halieaceae bacterium]|uniref:restriction endonuclease subunit S n=1 Tax=Haliea alexandrii TaxID=2448162 RepID=UPI001304CC01|nr:restriction endonuclease subunit S [Haliea alexandrii]MCR9186633.1 restriction endonuclease subunit S [Halieaceae bacterium]